jgi:hypothetical protein|tara:strand:- start:2436 stop:3377 length:942 start_codon:yes stop_codon:yes gene_type:complete
MRYKQNQRRRDPRYFLHEVPRPRPEQLKQLRKTVYDLLNSAGVDPVDISEYYRQLTNGVRADKLQQAWTQGENAVREFVENYVSRRGRKVSRDPRQMNLGLGDLKTISQEIRALTRRDELVAARRALRQHGTALEGELSIEGKDFVDHSKAPNSPAFKKALSDVINKVQLEVSQGKQKDEVIKNMFLPFAVGALSATGVITIIEQIIDSANETVAAEGEGEPAEYPEELETVGDQPEAPAQQAPVDDLVYHGEEPEAPNLPDGSENWSDEQFNDWLEKMGIEAESPPEEEMYENIFRTIKEETRRLLKQRGVI